MEVQFWFFIKPRRQKLTPLNQFWKKSGFGFLKYLENEKILALDRINGVHVDIRLTNINSLIMLSGPIRVYKIGNYPLASLDIQKYPTEKQARQLKSYIHSRQAEIYDELSNAVYLAVVPIETKDQYY